MNAHHPLPPARLAALRGTAQRAALASLLGLLALGPLAARPAAAGQRRDALGPRRAPSAAVLRVNGMEVDRRAYRRALRDGEISWRWMREMHEEADLLKGGLSKSEYLVMTELAEPLVVRYNFGEEQAKKHEALAWEAYRRAKAGEDWAALVDHYSTEPATKAKQGDVGVVAYDNLAAPFNRAMFTAPLGEVQPPVQTMFGYHVGRVTEVISPRDVTRRDGTVVRRPETRRVSQIMLLWQAPGDAVGSGMALKIMLQELRSQVVVEVLDRSLCDELPNWCARASIDAEAVQPEPAAAPAP